jgi:hypothetical protein
LLGVWGLEHSSSSKYVLGELKGRAKTAVSQFKYFLDKRRGIKGPHMGRHRFYLVGRDANLWEVEAIWVDRPVRDSIVAGGWSVTVEAPGFLSHHGDRDGVYRTVVAQLHDGIKIP